MKILSIIVQNKQGENIIVVTSNNFSHELAFRYSSLIYDNIHKKLSNPSNLLKTIR